MVTNATVARARVVDKSAEGERSNGTWLYVMEPTPGRRPNKLLVTIKRKSVITIGNARKAFLPNASSQNPQIRDIPMLSQPGVLTKREYKAKRIKITIATYVAIKAFVTGKPDIRVTSSAAIEMWRAAMIHTSNILVKEQREVGSEIS